MTLHPQKNYIINNSNLNSEWHTEKNTPLGLFPHTITTGSNKIAWWKCKICGYEWTATIKSRTRGSNCPSCTKSKNRIVYGVNDLLTVSPEVSKEWDTQKNLPLTTSTISANSHTIVWWKCKNGHEWQASPNHRVSKKRGCPYCCHNPKALKGINDFATIQPELLKEWHPTKNGTLSPNSITSNSSVKVWWICEKGHEWRTSANHRSNGSGCPYCSSASQTSFPEQAVFYYVKKYYPDAINKYSDLFDKRKMELDVYIPSLKLGIEYDGLIYHRTTIHKTREQKKYLICKENNVKLIRIRENLKQTDTSSCDDLIFVSPDLDSAITKLKTHLPCINNINTKQDRSKIQSMYLSIIKEHSFLLCNPQLAPEWNYSKNGSLLPEMFSNKSGESVWWICEKGHEWKAKIYDRVVGKKCPYCSNRLVLQGFNDLASKRPDLLSEWNYEKNTFLPTSITPGSGKKAWWKCKICGHEWFAEISSRNKGHNCPVCARNKSKNKKESV